MTRIAVVQFPGSNCERETVVALEAAGAAADIIRWNAADAEWNAFDGFVLPGGFSYEDRVRAGAVAAKHHVLDAVAAAADAGKPVLGVCNGAQILVEAGLVPGIEPGQVAVSLAANARTGWSGYYCEWIHLAARAERCWVAPLARSAEPVPMPVGNGEGRFTARAEVFDALARRGQIVFRYVAADGGPAAGADNPTGARLDAAGVCDPQGRVVALMPHPERARWLFQVPESLGGAWGRHRRAAAGDADALRGPGPGLALYEAFVRGATENREARR
jgi:phosphoribosylformylglycinamidine synthase